MKSTWLEWYADGSLRLDHYFGEAGSKANGNCLYESQVLNGTVPGDATRRAYVNDSGGFIPAEKISLLHPFDEYDTTAERELNTSIVAGLAASQGTWFGWYGGRGPLFYAGEPLVTLLRVLPGYDNLAAPCVFDGARACSNRAWTGNIGSCAHGVPPTVGTYTSSNSYFDTNIAYTRPPHTSRLLVVWRTSNGVLRLHPGERITAASLVDDTWTPTGDAMPALSSLTGDVRLTQASALRKGLVLTIAR